MAGKPFGLNQIKKIAERTAQKNPTAIQNMNELTFGLSNPDKIKDLQRENDDQTR